MLLIETKIEKESQLIEKEIVCVNPSPKTKFSTIYLSANKSSWITIEWLSEELLAYATENYQSLFKLHPMQRGKVVMHNNEECESPRWHRSYLYQPERYNQKSSYMYSGIEQFKDLSLPTQGNRF